MAQQAPYSDARLAKENLRLMAEVVKLRQARDKYSKTEAQIRDEFQADEGRQMNDEIDTLKFRVTSLETEVERLQTSLTEAEHHRDLHKSNFDEQIALQITWKNRAEVAEQRVDELNAKQSALQSHVREMEKQIESLVKGRHQERSVAAAEEKDDLTARLDQAEEARQVLTAKTAKLEEDLKARKKVAKEEEVAIERWRSLVDQALTLFGNTLIRTNVDASEATEQLSKCRSQTTRFREVISRERASVEQVHGSIAVGARTPRGESVQDRPRVVALLAPVVDFLLKASYILDERNDAIAALTKAQSANQQLGGGAGSPSGSRPSGGLQGLYMKR